MFSCDALDDATTVTVDLDPISIDLGAEVKSAVAASSRALSATGNYFEGNASINPAEILKGTEYAGLSDKVKSFKAEVAKIDCSSLAGYNIGDVVITASVGGNQIASHQIDSFEFDGTAPYQNAGLTAMVNTVMTSVVTGSTVVMAIEGYTDAPQGTDADFVLKIEEAAIKAGLINKK